MRRTRCASVDDPNTTILSIDSVGTYDSISRKSMFGLFSTWPMEKKWFRLQGSLTAIKSDPLVPLLLNVGQHWCLHKRASKMVASTQQMVIHNQQIWRIIMFAANFVENQISMLNDLANRKNIYPLTKRRHPWFHSIGPGLVCQKNVNGHTRNCRPVINNNLTTYTLFLSSHGTSSQNRGCGSFGSHHDGPPKTTGESEAAVISEASTQTCLTPQLFP